jgi:glucose/arabinose dehydrogenase
VNGYLCGMILVATIAILYTMSFFQKNPWLLLLPLAATLHCSKSDKKDNTPAGSVTLKDSVIVSGLSYPWEILWGPDNHIWMT